MPKRLNHYCATYKNGCYRVSTISALGNIREVHEIRYFSTFDEANTVAEHLALGLYPDIRSKGVFVNLR